MPTYTRWIDWGMSVEPGRAARMHFRWWSTLTCIVGGYIFARMTVDSQQIAQNGWYNRPDLKPKAAMVAEDENDVTKLSMLRNVYNDKTNLGDEKKGFFRRYFFPKDADFNLKYNPYRNTNPQDVYDPSKPYYPSSTNDFRDHVRD